jgi:hypothetical protein
MMPDKPDKPQPPQTPDDPKKAEPVGVDTSNLEEKRNDPPPPDSHVRSG